MSETREDFGRTGLLGIRKSGLLLREMVSFYFLLTFWLSSYGKKE